MKVLVCILTSLIFPFSSCNRIPSDRNRIIFESKFSDVKDSILATIEIMDKLYESKNITTYFFDLDGGFSIGQTYIGNVNNIFDDTLQIMKGISQIGKERFVKLIEYLKANSLPACFWNARAGTWCFRYRLTLVDHDDEHRFIILCSDEAILKNVRDNYEIIEIKDNFALVAMKEP